MGLGVQARVPDLASLLPLLPPIQASPGPPQASPGLPRPSPRQDSGLLLWTSQGVSGRRGGGGSITMENRDERGPQIGLLLSPVEQVLPQGLLLGCRRWWRR